MNEAGSTYFLSVFTPIAEGRTAALRHTIEGFATGLQSPFAQIASIHFARLVVLERLGHHEHAELSEELSPHVLYFAATFGGTLDEFLGALCREAGPTTDAVWSHCVSYPGVDDPEMFAAYITSHQVDNTFAMGTTPDATVAEVRDGLALRKKVIDFAVRTQDLAPADLRRAFRAAFTEG